MADVEKNSCSAPPRLRVSFHPTFKCMDTAKDHPRLRVGVDSGPEREKEVERPLTPSPLPARRGEGDFVLLRRWMVVDPRGVQPGHFWDTVSPSIGWCARRWRCRGRDRSFGASLVSPLQGSGMDGDQKPRAMPWAVMLPPRWGCGGTFVAPIPSCFENLLQCLVRFPRLGFHLRQGLGRQVNDLQFLDDLQDGPGGKGRGRRGIGYGLFLTL